MGAKTFVLFVGNTSLLLLSFNLQVDGLTCREENRIFVPIAVIEGDLLKRNRKIAFEFESH